ncbi:aspartate aminotransferase family protein [Paenibacillus sp. GYB003]|uniref:aspartate aminotransferase family protein n=1 Tax=Paenibacillus sp. GYB003 TaxID=2994392 RepID=UPI002F9623B3
MFEPDSTAASAGSPDRSDTMTEQLLADAERTILYTADRPGIVMERGEGMYLWDTEGKRYLDFIGGWAVTCLGHSPAAIREALARQSSTLVNASPAFYNKPMIELARLLTRLSGFDKAFFASSGAEANEGAIKLARKHGAVNLGGASEIVTATNGFHGRTLATMSATGKARWEPLFAPKVPGFKHVPFNDAASMRTAVDGRTCAVMLELVQGEGGVNEADADYVRSVRELCDESGAMLIFDEIQTGLGRTGNMFAFEHYGVRPDVLTLGKGIGGGFPLSAMLAARAFDLFEPGDQGGTYTGQPLAMAVGHAVVSEIANRKLHENAEAVGEYVKNGLSRIADAYGLSRIRGKGLLLAFDLHAPYGPDLVAECLRGGLLINSPSPTAIRLMPPLIVTKEQADDMLLLLSEALDRCSRRSFG